MDVQPDIPWTLDAITDDWLDAALRESGVLGEACVIAHKVGAAPETGLVASAAPLQVSYDRVEAGAPSSIYVKCTRHVPDICETEVGFYRDLAPWLGDIVPRCFGAWWNGRSRSTILLEDMASFEVGTWWTYAVDDAARALEAIARVHARYWDRAPVVSWLHLSRTLTPEAIAALAAAIDPFASRFPFESARVLAEASRAMLRRPDDLAALLAGFPQTLTHQDFHSQNVFPRSRPGGRTTIFDWQLTAPDLAAVDVAYHLAASLPVADRRSAEDMLLDRYLAALTAEGVRGFDAKSLRRQYALGLYRIIYVMTATLGSYPLDALNRSNERAHRYGVEDGWREMIDRVAAAASDHRFLSLVP